MTKARHMRGLSLTGSRFLRRLPLPIVRCKCYSSFSETQNSFEGISIG